MLKNKKDLAILKNTEQQNLMAKDILKGIENYLAQKEKNSGLSNQEFPKVDSSKATNEEMAEYLDLTTKYKTQSKKYIGYNFEKITLVEEERLFTIFCKMSKEQQESLKVYFVKPINLHLNLYLVLHS